MHKTTLYLDRTELRRLKVMAAQKPGKSTSDLVRLAIRDFLGRQKRPPGHLFLKKILRRKPSKTVFGDPVDYQRRLRNEWR